MRKRGSGGLPASLGDALNRLIQTKGIAKPKANAQLVQLWKSVTDDRVSEHTKVLGVHRGVLQVGVFSASLLHELVSFQQSELLSRLQEADASLNLQGIKFKLRSDLRPKDQSAT